MTQKPKPASLSDIEPEIISIKQRFLAAQYSDSEPIPGDNISIEEEFNQLIDEEVGECRADNIRGLVSHDWYLYFSALAADCLEWQRNAVRYTYLANDNPFLLLDSDHMEREAQLSAMREMIPLIIEAARDSGMANLLGPEKTAKVLQDIFAPHFPVTPDDIQILNTEPQLTLDLSDPTV